MDPTLIVVAAGAGIVLLRDKDAPVTKTTGSLTTAPSKPNTNSVKARFSKYSLNKESARRLSSMRQTPASSAGNGGSKSGLPKEVEDRILADLKKKWEAATGDAKMKICQNLKSQFPGNAGIQSLDCSKIVNQKFQAVVAVVGAAVGASVCGPPCSVVGSMVAAWAGPKLEEMAKKAWDKAKDWGEELWPGNWW